MNRKWWKEAVVYQVYPRSFYDSDGDGIGDLNGVTCKLDYLKELGVDVIWLNPVYKSPNDDNGYDISDYYGIMEEFGSFADWERLLDEVHKRGMKLIMDLVVNHTSDEHAWFMEARASRDSGKRDYYIWCDAVDGHEPNNWGSFFSPSAWEWDSGSAQYYLHLFSVKQPDLNWENAGVREEIYKMMRWWLDKGIDGFRMDVINAVSKAEGLPDAPAAPDASGHASAPEGKRTYSFSSELYFNQTGIHEFLQEMNREALSGYDIMTVGETPAVTPEDGILYTDEDRGELNMIFQFEHMELDSGKNGKWDAVPWKLSDLKKVMTRWQLGLRNRGWNSLYLNNHDQPRMVSRFGNDAQYRVESATMLATMLHTMQGTPYIYQGEEIGMTNVKFDSIDEYRDIETFNFYNMSVRENKEDIKKVMNSIYIKGRDNARTPMQWNGEENAGFTSGRPWIGVNPNYREINAEEALKDPGSVFCYYQKLIRLRKENLTLVYGDFIPLLEEDKNIFAYIRKHEGDRLLVIMNFFEGRPVFMLPDGVDGDNAELLLSNYPAGDDGSPSEFVMKPYEARVYRLDQKR